MHHFATLLLASCEISDDAVRLERSLQFMLAPGEELPDASALEKIKEALATYGEYGVLVKKRTELVLLYANGQVI